MEEGGERWSKPHVATLSLHALFELRRGLSTGTVMLDADAANIAQVAGEPITTLLGGSVVRALDSGPIGREFDSRRLRFRVTRSTQPSIPPG